MRHTPHLIQDAFELLSLCTTATMSPVMLLMILSRLG